MDTAFILNHLGEEREKYFNAVSPLISQSTNFCYPTVDALRQALKKEFENPFYTRGYNPTVAILRKKVAALEGSEDALIFSSGSAAIAAAVMSTVKGGDHVVCVKRPYSWTKILLEKYLVPYGVTTTFIDGADITNFEAAIRKSTKLIYVESPNSLTFELQDLRAVAKLAKKHGITTICDNSYSSPLNQSPIKLGIDIVTHSASKYLNGHSDVVAGVLCTTRECVMKMFGEEFMTLGGIISPHDAWLMIRGLRTLEIRVKRSSESAQRVAEYLEKHPKIEKVLYPFLPSNPQYALAKKQMKSGAGLLSIVIKAKDVKQVERFCDALKYFLLTCSWGGYESLAFPICSMHQSQSYDNPLPWNLVRLYIGLEDPDVLIADLKRALDKV